MKQMIFSLFFVAVGSFRIFGPSVLVSALSMSATSEPKESKVVLSELPYPYNSLEPVVSERTLRFHHDKHLAAYVGNTNNLIKDTPLMGEDLVTIIRQAHKDKNQALFNNAAQVFNHDFYFKCMKQGGGGKPSEKLLLLLTNQFGSFENFKTEFINAGMTTFGSGWAWLVLGSGGLRIVSGPGAHTPVVDKSKAPLLVTDVWEHAYYLDFQNQRLAYLQAFMDKLVDWDFVEKQLDSSSRDEL